MPTDPEIRESIKELQLRSDVAWLHDMLSAVNLEKLGLSDYLSGTAYKKLLGRIDSLKDQTKPGIWLDIDHLTALRRDVVAAEEACVSWMDDHNRSVVDTVGKGKSDTEVKRFESVGRAVNTLQAVKKDIDWARNTLRHCNAFIADLNALTGDLKAVQNPRTWDPYPAGYDDVSAVEAMIEPFQDRWDQLCERIRDLEPSYVKFYTLGQRLGGLRAYLQMLDMGVQHLTLLERGDERALHDRARDLLYSERKAPRPFSLSRSDWTESERAFEGFVQLTDTDEAEETLRGALADVTTQDLTVGGDDPDAAKRFAAAIVASMGGIVAAVDALPHRVEEIVLEAWDGVRRNQTLRVKAMVRLLGQIWLLPILDRAASTASDPDGMVDLTDILDQICRGTASTNPKLAEAWPEAVTGVFAAQEERWNAALSRLDGRLAKRSEEWWAANDLLKTAADDVRPHLKQVDGAERKRLSEFLHSFRDAERELWSQLHGDWANLIDGQRGDPLIARLEGLLQAREERGPDELERLHVFGWDSPYNPLAELPDHGAELAVVEIHIHSEPEVDDGVVEDGVLDEIEGEGGPDLDPDEGLIRDQPEGAVTAGGDDEVYDEVEGEGETGDGDDLIALQPEGVLRPAPEEDDVVEPEGELVTGGDDRLDPDHDGSDVDELDFEEDDSDQLDLYARPDGPTPGGDDEPVGVTLGDITVGLDDSGGPKRGVL